MKKKQRQMIGMLLALVVLAAAFLGIRQYNKNASSATSTTEDTQETVLDVNSDDITSFRYVYEGETYAFEKEDDTWYYADDHSLNLNQDRIKAMILKVELPHFLISGFTSTLSTPVLSSIPEMQSARKIARNALIMLIIPPRFSRMSTNSLPVLITKPFTIKSSSVFNATC